MRLVYRAAFLSALAACTATFLTAQVGVGAHPSIGTGAAHAPTATGGRPYPISPGYAPPVGLTSPAAAYTGIRYGAYNSRANYGHVGHGSAGYNGRNRYSRVYPFLPITYFAAPYYYPWFDYGGPPEDNGPENPPNDSAQQGSLIAENALGEQLARISAQLDELRSNQNAQAQQGAPLQQGSPVAQEPPSPPNPPITLVLHNGQQLRVQNYAVMNQTFWDFTNTPAKRIPISQIDLQASTKATAASGGEFPQIGPNPSAR